MASRRSLADRWQQLRLYELDERDLVAALLHLLHRNPSSATGLRSFVDEFGHAPEVHNVVSGSVMTNVISADSTSSLTLDDDSVVDDQADLPPPTANPCYPWLT